MPRTFDKHKKGRSLVRFAEKYRDVYKRGVLVWLKETRVLRGARMSLERWGVARPAPRVDTANSVV